MGLVASAGYTSNVRLLPSSLPRRMVPEMSPAFPLNSAFTGVLIFSPLDGPAISTLPVHLPSISAPYNASKARGRQMFARDRRGAPSNRASMRSQ